MGKSAASFGLAKVRTSRGPLCTTELYRGTTVGVGARDGDGEGMDDWVVSFVTWLVGEAAPGVVDTSVGVIAGCNTSSIMDELGPSSLAPLKWLNTVSISKILETSIANELIFRFCPISTSSNPRWT